MTSYGTQREYKDGFYIQNTMFPLQASELHVDNSDLISTFYIKLKTNDYLVVMNIEKDLKSILSSYQMNMQLS